MFNNHNAINDNFASSGSNSNNNNNNNSNEQFIKAMSNSNESNE